MSREWPDELAKTDTESVAALLVTFWRDLADLPDLVAREEQLLCAELLNGLRATVLEMMLALNGIARPGETRHLNTYLSDRQRRAIEKTLILPAPDRDGWIGQAVALIVIYHWYAPQLVDGFDVAYPDDAEEAALQRLSETLPDWPHTISTDQGSS